MSPPIPPATTPKTLSLWDVGTKAEKDFEIPTGLLRGLGMEESSGFNHWDENGNIISSPTGPRGAMQFTRKTARDVGGIDRDNPIENVLGGAKYLRQNYDALKGKVHDDTERWLAASVAHNRGLGAVEGMIKDGRFEPSGKDSGNGGDTRAYATRIANNWAKLRDGSPTSMPDAADTAPEPAQITVGGQSTALAPSLDDVAQYEAKFGKLPTPAAPTVDDQIPPAIDPVGQLTAIGEAAKAGVRYGAPPDLEVKNQQAAADATFLQQNPKYVEFLHTNNLTHSPEAVDQYNQEVAKVGAAPIQAPDINPLLSNPDGEQKSVMLVVRHKDNPDGTTTNFLSDGTQSIVRYTKNADGGLTPVEVENQNPVAKTAVTTANGTNADLEAENTYRKSQGQEPLTAAQFAANPGGKVDVSINPNDFKSGNQKLTDLERETPTPDGGTIRYPREVGQQSDNLQATAGIYRSTKGMSEEQAAVNALVNASKGELSPDQATEYVRRIIKDTGGAVGKGGYKSGDTLTVSYEALQAAGMDVKSAMRMEQVQNRLSPEVSASTPVEKPKEVLSKEASDLAETIGGALANTAIGTGDYAAGGAGAVSGALKDVGQGWAPFLSGVYQASIPGLADALTKKILGGQYTPDVVKALEKAGAFAGKVGESSDGDSVMYKVGQFAGETGSAGSRIVLTTAMTGGNPIVGMAAEAALRNYGGGVSPDQFLKETGKGAVLGAIFHGSSKLGDWAGKAIFGKTITAETEAALKNPVMRQAYDNAVKAGENIELSPDLRAAIFRGQLAKQGVKLGTVTSAGIAEAKLEGKSWKEALKQGGVWLIQDLAMSFLAGGKGRKLEDLDGRVVRVPDAAGKPQEVLLLKGEDGLDAVDVSKANIPDAAVDAVVLPKPDIKANADKFAPGLTDAEKADLTAPVKAPEGTFEPPSEPAKPVVSKADKEAAIRASSEEVEKGTGKESLPVEPSPIKPTTTTERYEAQKVNKLAFGKRAAKEVSGGKDALQTAWNQYNDTGEIGSAADLADKVRELIDAGKAPESLEHDIADYHKAVAEDLDEYGGRSGLDNEAKDRFLKAVQAELGPQKEAKPAAKKQAVTIDVSPIEKAQTVQEVYKVGGGMLKAENTNEGLAQIQTAIKKRASEIESAPSTTETRYTAQKAAKQADKTSVIAKPDKAATAVNDEVKRDISSDKSSAKQGTQKVITERGTEATVKPRVIDASDIVTSLEPGYPSELQPRDRDRAASRAQISDIANRLDPEQLSDSRKASDGRPLVVPMEIDGKTKYVAISGNGRTAAIKHAYSLDNAPSKAYREFTQTKESHDLKEPVYVGILDPKEIDLQTFSREANESATAKMSATEQAKVDAEKITTDTMGLFVPSEDGSIHSAANRDFIRAFLQHAVAKTDQGGLVDENGQLSQEGQNRVRNAIFAKVYGDQAVKRLAESADSNVKRATSALLKVAPKFAMLNDMVESGARHPGLAISHDVSAALEKFAYLREKGTDIETYIRQQGLFGDDLTPFQKRILVEFDNYKNSTAALSGILNNYIELANALGNPKQAQLFGEPIAANSATVFEQAVVSYSHGKEADTTQTSLFDSDQGRKTESQTPRTPEKDRPESAESDIIQSVAKDADKNLIAVHNLSESNLMFTDRLGGLAVPSIAIVNKDSQFGSFGEITLIAKPDLIDPKNRVPVTDADMYSPRYPSAQIHVNKSKFEKEWNKVKANWLEHYPKRESYSLEYYVPEAALRDDGLRGLTRDDYFTAYALKESGIELPKDPHDIYKVAREHEGEIEEVAQQIVEDSDGEMKFFKGYTNSGNRRYGKYDLETIVKKIKSEMKEGEGFNYGAGTLRSKATTRFKSIEQIQQNRDRIVSAEDIEDKKSEMSDRLFELAQEMGKYYEHSATGMGLADTFSEALGEGSSRKNLRRSLDEYGFKDIDAEDFQKITDYIQELISLPTEYFEAKPQRAVGLHEFETAIVPDDISGKARKILERHGLDIVEYKSGDKADRQRAVSEAAHAADILFKAKTPQSHANIEHLTTLTGDELMELPADPLDAGKLNENGELEISERAAEVLRKLQSEIMGGKEVKAFDGALWRPGAFETMVPAVREAYESAIEAGYDEKQVKWINDLANNLDDLAVQSTRHGIVYVFDNALPEERVHREDALAGSTDETARTTLDDSPFLTAPKFAEDYGNYSRKDKMAEVFAKLATGQEAYYGFDKVPGFEDAKQHFLATYADGIIRNNGIETLSQFEAFAEKYRRIAAYANFEKGESQTGENNNGEAEGNERDAERGPETGRAPPAGEGESETGQAPGESAEIPGSGELKARKTVLSAERHGIVDINEITGAAKYYRVKSTDERTARAQDRIERLGLQAATDEAMQPITDLKTADEQNAFRKETVLLLNRLARESDTRGDTALATGYRATRKQIVEAMAETGTAGGRFIQSMDWRDKDDADSVVDYVNARRRREGYGVETSAGENKQLVDGAENLAKAEAKISALEAKLAELEQQMKGPKNRPLNRAQKSLLQTLRTNADNALKRVMGMPLAMVAWHGSPHKFEKFDSSKIGTGEGAQAYGHGLYFTDQEQIADHYRNANPNGIKQVQYQGKDVSANPTLRQAVETIHYLGGKKAAIEKIKAAQEWAKANPQFQGIDLDKVLQHIREVDPKQIKEVSGAKYRVDLKPAPEDYLLWDKPLSEQSEKVKKVFGLDDNPNSSSLDYKTMGDYYKALTRSKGSQTAASDYLHSRGIRGIKYLDGTSRGKGEGSYNYVIFDDKDVEITDILASVSQPPAQSLQGQILNDLSDVGAAILFNGFNDEDIITPEQFETEFNKQTDNKFAENWRQVHAESMAKLKDLRTSARRAAIVDRIKGENLLASDAEVQSKADAEIAAEKATAKERAGIRGQHTKLANEILLANRRATRAVEKDIKKKTEKKLANHTNTVDFLGQAAKLDPNASDDVLALSALIHDDPTLTTQDALKFLRKISDDYSVPADASGTKVKEVYSKTNTVIAAAKRLRDRVNNENRKAADIARGQTDEIKKQIADAKRERLDARRGFDSLVAKTERPPQSAIQKATQLQRMMMVSAINTATNNLLSGMATRGMVRVVDVLDTGIQKVGKLLGADLKSEGITADTRWADVMGFPQGDDAGFKQYFSQLAFAHQAILAALDEHPELFNEIYGDYSSDIKNPDDIDTQNGIIHKVLDTGTMVYDKLNFANRWQEYAVRDLEAFYALQVRLGQRGLNFTDLQRDGELNKISAEDWQFAMKRARHVTFALSPERGSLGDRTLRALNNHPVPAVIIAPFAKFSWNVWNLTRDWLPIAAQIRAGRRVNSEEGAKFKDAFNPKNYTSREMANSLAGFIFFGAALALVRNLGDRDDWYYLKVPYTEGMGRPSTDFPKGAPLYIDMRQHPEFAPFLYLANKFNRLIEGRDMFNYDDPKGIASELGEVFLSLSYRQAIDQNSLIQGAGYGIDSALFSTDREKNAEKSWDLLTKFAGERMGIAFSPFRPLKNITDSLSKSGDLDMDAYPFTSGFERNLPKYLFEQGGLRDKGVPTKKNVVTGEPKQFNPYQWLKPFGLNIVDDQTAEPEMSQTLRTAKKLEIDTPYTPPVTAEEKNARDAKRDIYKAMEDLRKQETPGMSGEQKATLYKPITDAVKKLVDDKTLRQGQADYILQGLGKSQLESLVSRGSLTNALKLAEMSLTDKKLKDEDRAGLMAIAKKKLEHNDEPLTDADKKRIAKLGIEYKAKEVKSLAEKITAGDVGDVIKIWDERQDDLDTQQRFELRNKLRQKVMNSHQKHSLTPENYDAAKAILGDDIKFDRPGDKVKKPVRLRGVGSLETVH